MRLRWIHTTIPAVVAVFGVAAGVSARQANAPGLLAAPQVRELVTSQRPDDHARLKAHFEALAAKYTADANRHAAFASATANIPRGIGASASVHHTRLAANATESAKVVRELAAHHGLLGTGVASTAPRGSERFEQGAGAPPTPTEKEMLELAARAQTPREHEQLSEYYTTLAARYTSDAKDHRAMAQTYRSQNRVNQSAVADCERLVQLSEKSAKETEALATEHRQKAAGR